MNVAEAYFGLKEKPLWNRAEISSRLGSAQLANWYIFVLSRKNLIQKVRKDLYTVTDLGDSSPLANRFQIASKITDDSFLSHHSALEYFGFAHQQFTYVYVSSSKRFTPFEYGGYTYVGLVSDNSFGIVENDDGVRVTCLERTIIDSLADFEKIGGLEEFLHCLSLVTSLDDNLLLGALSSRGHAKFYQKAGYLFEQFGDEIDVSDRFIRECEKHIPQSKAYFGKQHIDYCYFPKWKLYAPRRLKAIIYEGEDDDFKPLFT
ncbi:MAG: type IV toxin-antitoxin system AbiEi family antitoxin [Bacillota bacterium]|nr:type IV toxin-antitoxin system AbiEi family antitoxin [Bacillota bacterium]